MWAVERIEDKKVKPLKAKNDNVSEISFFDVKELYDAAYAEKAKTSVNLHKFNVLMAQAVAMDEAYREQLKTIKPFKYREAA
tara:strand:- start:349 stop:594 length:246 start_codon:yes stop_codon:yes gene_type:complete